MSDRINGDELSRYNTAFPRTQISCENCEDYLRLSIVGELDILSSNAARPLILSIMEQLPPGYELLIDLSRLVYISSTGVGLLTSVLMEAKKKGVELVLGEIHPKVEDVLRLLGVLSFFKRMDRG